MNSYEVNPGIFKVIKVEWGNKGPNFEKAVIVTLKAEDGEVLSVANNWARGQQQRYDFAKTLIGKDIRYSTWQKNLYSKEWFKELELVDHNEEIEKPLDIRPVLHISKESSQKKKVSVKYNKKPTVTYKEKLEKLPKNNQDKIYEKSKKVIKGNRKPEEFSKGIMHQKMKEAFSQLDEEEDDSDDIKPF